MTKEIALCGFFATYALPKEHPDGYLIFSPDADFNPINLSDNNGNTVTVSGYAECLHYQNGDYYYSEASTWGNTTQLMNQLVGFFSLVSIALITINKRREIDEYIE